MEERGAEGQGPDRDAVGALTAAFAAGEVERRNGHPARALSFLDRALTACQSLGVATTEELLRAATCHLVWAEVALDVPHVDGGAVDEVTTAAATFAHDAGAWDLCARAALVRAKLRIAADDPRHAADELADAVAYVRVATDVSAASRATLLVEAAHLAAMLGLSEVAAEWLDLAWRTGERSLPVMIVFLLAVGRVALQGGRAFDALEQARTLVALAEPEPARTRLAAWKLRAEAASAAHLHREATASARRIHELVRIRGTSDALSAEALFSAVDAAMDADAWEGVDAMLRDAEAISSIVALAHPSWSGLRRLADRRARWFVEHAQVDAADLRPTA